jgi:hypothetical protein
MPLYEGLTYTLTCTITQGPNDWVPANNSDTITIKIQTDLAITKIFADSISKNLMITIKNLGTVVVDKKINASCELNPQDPPAGVVGSKKNFTINQQIYPGASFDIDTGLSTNGIYANTWAFCRLLPPYSDSKNANNDLEIKIK